MRSPLEAMQGAVLYVADAFRPHALPQKPVGKLTKAQKDKYRLKVEAANAQNEIFRRRRLGVLGVVGTTVLGAAAVGTGIVDVSSFLPVYTEPVETFSGEIDETKAYLDQWEKDVKDDENKFEKYAPKITNLAVAYFSKQMSKMYPDREEQYKKDNFKNIFRFYRDSNEYDAQSALCEKPNRTEPVMFSSYYSNTVAFFPKKLFEQVKNKRNIVKTAFWGSMHELLHIAAPNVAGGENIFVDPNIRDRVVFKRGLNVFVRRDNTSPLETECPASTGFSGIEEIVVENAAIKLVSKVGISIEESGYATLLSYYQKMLDEKFNGRFEELLAMQQTTNADGFYALVGEKYKDDYVVDLRGQQIRIGDSFAEKVALGTYVIGPVFYER